VSQLNRVSNDCASQLFNNFFKSSWNWDRIGSEEHHDHSLASRGLTVRSRWSASALLGTGRLQACTMAIALGQHDRTARRECMCCSVAQSGGQSRQGGSNVTTARRRGRWSCDGRAVVSTVASAGVAMGARHGRCSLLEG